MFKPMGSDSCMLDPTAALPGTSSAQGTWTRREVLRGLGAAVLTAQLSPLAEASLLLQEQKRVGRQPIVDSHIHLYDPTRPDGVPWPEKSNTVLFRPALPERYRALSAPLDVVAAIAIECSPLVGDNDWLLKTVRTSTLMVGAIGDLDPALPTFAAELERLHRDPLFLGIRYGNLWGRNLGSHLDDERFIENLRTFAQTGLVFEVPDAKPELAGDLVRLIDLVPNLRMLIDHLPHVSPPTDVAARNHYVAKLQRLSEHPNVFAKGSEIVRQIDGKVSLQIDQYRPWLDTLWSLFGEDRMVFGSDWPNSDTTSPVGDVFTLAERYLATKSPAAAQKFFSRNSARVYRWHPRTDAQRLLLESRQA